MNQPIPTGMIPGLDAPVSRLFFGTAIRPLLAGEEQSLELLDSVLDSGIDAFDCARSYGLAEKHPNAYFDLSGNGLSRWHMLRWGIDRIGKERFLFGTDYPVVNPYMFMAGVFSEQLSYDERKAIFHDNFLRLTGYTEIQ